MAKKKRTKAPIGRGTSFMLGGFVFMVAFFLTFAIIFYYNVGNITGLVPMPTPSQVLLGKYSGVTPCADCSGIKTTLNLYVNPNVYSQELVYEGRDTSFTENGTWTVEEMTGNPEKMMYVLTPNTKNGSKTMYEVLSSTQIRQLDGDGKEIPDSLPFTLTKASN